MKIAVLETELDSLKTQYERDMAEVKADLKVLLGKFNEMTGGQKAWFALSAILGAIVGIAGTVFSAIALLPRHH